MSRRGAASGASIALIGALIVAGVGCGEDDTPAPPPSPPEQRAGSPGSGGVDQEPVTRGGGQGATGGERRSRLQQAIESGGAAEPEDTAGQEAIRTARDYIGALDAGDGKLVCELLAPDALDGFELPRDRAGCAASLDASIGYRDPRGLPVWEGAEVGAVPSVEVEDTSASVTLTVVTEFADREQVSVEDDIVYLERDGESWRVAKPSLTLHRAVGREPPPSAIAAP